MTVRIAVVGDVHGDADALRAVVHAIPDSRKIILVGDYIDTNRGAGSRAVLDLLVALVQERDTSPLLGNHDQALLHYVQSGDIRVIARIGGLGTIREYTGDVRGSVHAAFLDCFPNSHRRLLESLPRYWENNDVFVSHAGFNPADHADRTDPFLLHGIAGAALFAHGVEGPRATSVFGHFVQPRPFMTGSLACIDTGCGRDTGRLACLLLPEREFIYADSKQGKSLEQS